MHPAKDPAKDPAAAPRYLVLLPSVGKPVGGVNILLWLIETLNAAGYRAAALHGSGNDTYDFRGFTGERFYSSTLDHMFRAGFFRRGRRAWAQQGLRDLWRRLGLLPRPHLPTWQPEPQDVLIVPEYMYPEAVAAFAGRRCILAVQGYMVLMRTSLRSRRWQGEAPEAFSAIFSTSQACVKAVGAIFDTKSAFLPLPVCHPGLSFNPDKKLQIALMQRKRPEEARILAALIRQHPDLAGVPLVMIDQVPAEEAQRLIRESLIFLSLSEQEGFGLPPAEAMATGSLVIGYTGVGGDEYFTAETGFPIPDGDIVAFVARLAEVVSAWRHDPAALDAKRRQASDFIWAQYDQTAARQSLLDLWTDIDARLRRDRV